MKKLYLIVGLLALLPLFIIGSGCEKEKNNHLLGTWKCIGFGNTETDEVRPIEPQDCDKCYTITFKKDYKIEGHSSTNRLMGTYKLNKKELQIIQLGGTEVNEIEDGNLYVNNLKRVTEYYFADKNQLLLYLNDKKEYLIFKPI